MRMLSEGGSNIVYTQHNCADVHSAPTGTQGHSTITQHYTPMETSAPANDLPAFFMKGQVRAITSS